MAQNYARTNFVNNKTKLNAETLNKIDKALEAVANMTEGHEKQLNTKKLKLNDLYECEITEIDPGTGLWQVQIQALDSENGFNILALKAPQANPTEATLALMCVGDDGFCQFVDISCLAPFDGSWDGRGTFEIVAQARGTSKLPPMIAAFNDGTAGRVKKLVIYPDAIPMEFTASGIKVRKNNNFDNNVTDEDFEIINLIEMKNAISALQSGGTTISPLSIDITDFSNYLKDFFVIQEDNNNSTETEIPTELSLIYNWDFTNGLIDTIAGAEATALYCKNQGDRIDLYYGESNLYLGACFGLGRKLEVDISSMTKGFDDTVHGRFLMIYEDGANKSEGLVWRKQTQTWSFYADGAWSDAISSDAAVFSGKTLKIVSDSSGYLSVYADDEYIGKSSIKFDSTKTHVCIGGYADSFYDTVITGVRVYG